MRRTSAPVLSLLDDPMSSSLEVPVSPSALRASVGAWMIRAATWPSSPYELLHALSPHGSSSRMFPAFYPQPQDATSDDGSTPWEASGIRAPGGCWTRSIGEEFMHRLRLPLAEAVEVSTETHGQGDLFANECEGICGV